MAGVADEQLAFGPFGYRRQRGEGRLAHAEARIGGSQRALGHGGVRHTRRAATQRAGEHRRRRPITDQRCAAGQIVRIEQRGQRAIDEARIAIPGGAVGHRQLGSLGDRVDELGRCWRVRLQPRMAQHPELLQEHRALAPDIALGHAVTAKVQRDRRLDRGLPVLHVLEAQQADVLFASGVAYRRVAAVRVDLLGHEALIPAAHGRVDLALAGVALRDRSRHDARIGIGQHRQRVQTAGARHLAVRQPGIGRAVPFVAEQRLHGKDRLRDAGHERKAVARVADGRLKHVGERPGAVITQHRHPCAERPRHRRRHQPDAGHHLHAHLPQRFRISQRRGGALAADRARGTLTLAPEQDRHLTARPVQMWLHHLQHEAGCHCGIERIAAAFEHAHGGLRGKPVGGSGNAECADDLGACREHEVSAQWLDRNVFEYRQVK